MWNNYYQKTETVDEVIREIEFGRGQSQLFDLGLGGQQERKYNSPDELEVDTLDFLRALKPYEVRLQPYFMTDDDYRNENYFYIEDYVERIFVGAKSSGCDNTYNHNSPISNDIESYLFTFPGIEERYVYAIRIHLHGDIRGNYSPYMIFSLSCEEYFDAVYEASRKVEFEVRGFSGKITISQMEEEIRVEYEDEERKLDFYMCAESVNEVVERVEEELKELEVMEDEVYREWVKDVDE